MSKYNTFLSFFITAVVAFVIFMILYVRVFLSFIFFIQGHSTDDISPFQLLTNIFTPPVIIAGAILGICSLVYRILGIVYVAKSKTPGDGEKALWIIGFVIMGFITGIVFLVMAKGRKIV